MTSTFIALALNVLPCKEINHILFFVDITSSEISYGLILMFVLTNIFFVVTWKRNPGYLEKSKKVSFVRMVEKFDPNMLCPTCEVICT